MKLLKTLLDGIVKACEVLLMLLVGGLAAVILFELSIRNLLNKSFRSSIEICSILFMWMVFLGIIYLYNHSRLMRFEILLSRVAKPVQRIFWYINKAASILLGAIMVISYINIYEFVSTRYFSTMTWLPYSVQYFPMAFAGGFMVVNSIYQIIENTMKINSPETVWYEGGN